MNLSTLQAHGVTAAYSGSRLFLHGLDHLNPAEATQIVEMVRKDKFRLLAELAGNKSKKTTRGEEAQEPKQTRRITPTMIRN